MKTLSLIILLFASLAWAEDDPLIRKADAYVDSTGWAVAEAKPAADLIRWIKFEDGMNRCRPCMDMARDKGMMLAFHRFYMEGIGGYWAVLLDIPYDMTLIFDDRSSVVMITEDGEVRSSNLVFPVGWNPMPQHSIRETAQGPVYVRGPAFGNGPTSNDYEWARLRSEWDGLPKYYVVGYARFKHSGDPIGWRVDGVQTTTRR